MDTRTAVIAQLRENTGAQLAREIGTLGAGGVL